MCKAWITHFPSVLGLLLMTAHIEAETATLPQVSPAIAQLAKLQQSGVNQEVMLAFVQNSSVPKPNAEELIYLHEQGVATSVITSLLNRKDAPVAATASAASAPTVPANQPTPNPAPTEPLIVGSAPSQPQSSVIYFPASGSHYVPRYNESYFAPYFGTYPFVGPTFSVGVGFGHYGHFGHYRGHHGGWRHHQGHHSLHHGHHSASHHSGHHGHHSGHYGRHHR